ncbi:MAG: hypothetical protein ACI9HB_002993 [Gammaproteobacteria bacterium]|jgi:hypothetical protein
MVEAVVVSDNLAKRNGWNPWSGHIICLSCNVWEIADRDRTAVLFVLLWVNPQTVAGAMAFRNDIAGGGRLASGVQGCSSTPCSIRAVVPSGKRYIRPLAAIGHHLKMLQRGPSLRPFVHFAAFLLAETSVCGTNWAFAAVAPMTASMSNRLSRKASLEQTRPQLVHFVGVLQR